MYKKGENLLNFRVKTILLIAALLFTFSALFITSAYSGDFKLIKINSHYEPELAVSPPITLPGTNIKIGSYIYILNNGMEVGRLGFLIDSKNFYFVQSAEYNLIAPDFNYGAYDGYFVIDASGYASATGHNRLMFLCKYDNQSVQLLDVIGQAYVESYEMDFKPITADKDKSCITDCSPGQIIMQDFDHDGTIEIEMIISNGFKLYFEINSNRLQVDINPALYKPLFEKEKHKSRLKLKPLSYYIYGFLANELKFEEIKTMLKADREQYRMVVALLKNVKRWNAAFHGVGGEKFVLKQYNLKRR